MKQKLEHHLQVQKKAPEASLGRSRQPFKARKMPSFCKDGRFEILVLNPALQRRQRDQQLKEALQAKCGVDEHKFDHLLCVPERFQRYFIDAELKKNYYKNKSVPFAREKPHVTGLRRVNNVLAKKSKARRPAKPVKQDYTRIAKLNSHGFVPSRAVRLETSGPALHSRPYSVPRIETSRLALIRRKRSQVRRANDKNKGKTAALGQGKVSRILNACRGLNIGETSDTHELFFE